MVARLVRDQEVVGSSPVTSTTKTGERFSFRPFLRSDGNNPRPLFLKRDPENCAPAEFLGRGETEANASIAPSGNARNQPTVSTRVQVRHLDHKKEHCFAAMFFFVCGTDPRPLFLKRAPENCASAEFLGRGETEANASIALSGNARKSRPFRRGFKSRHLDHKKGHCSKAMSFFVCGTNPRPLF